MLRWKFCTSCFFFGSSVLSIQLGNLRAMVRYAFFWALNSNQHLFCSVCWFLQPNWTSRNQSKVPIKFVFAVYTFYLGIGGSILVRWRASFRFRWNCNVYSQRSMLNAVRNNEGSPSGKRKWEPIFYWNFSHRRDCSISIQVKIIMCVAENGIQLLQIKYRHLNFTRMI